MREYLAEIENAAFEAWPAAIVAHLLGWRLRYTFGVTRRANSVWPNQWHGGKTEQALVKQIDAVETFYRRFNAPARFQICPGSQPAGLLTTHLTNRGYSPDSLTYVQRATVETVLSKTSTNDVTVQLDSTLTPQWDDMHRTFSALNASNAHTRNEIMRRIPQAAFMSIACDGQPAAIGTASLTCNWVGVANVHVATNMRRRGLGKQLMHATALWAQSHGITDIFLQVMASNQGAQALYAGMGFETVYGYEYWEQM